jgi:hypothetical protein
MNTMSTEKTVLGVIAGLAIGSALGILFAPDKGTTTRRKLSKKSERYVEDLGDKFNEFIEGITDRFEAVKKEAVRMAENGKAKMVELEANGRAKMADLEAAKK